MPSRKTPGRWLLQKEWRELLNSRAWWIFLVLSGPLVGFSFIDAVNTYAEVSGFHGTSMGVGEAFSPLVGIWNPTFGACEIAAAFLLPFVAIHLVAGDQVSGALKLELQHPMSEFRRITTKASILLVGWMIALLGPVTAMLLWDFYGGSIYLPELATVAFGHLLNACLVIALAAAAASVSEHPATAAIITLSVTVGTWVVSFIGAVHGGFWEALAGYTPTAMVAQFQHGLIRLDVVFIAIALIATGLGVAAIWMRIGLSIRRRLRDSLLLAGLASVVIVASTFVRASWDTSEARLNSFSKGDEATLRQIRSPLQIEAYLAPEDPRRTDLERRVLSKLRRVLPSLEVQYSSATSIGLFEQTGEHYGEVWYSLGGHRLMNRATTQEAVLETIYSLAEIKPPVDNDDVFRGHPLAAPPKGAALVFYGAWPVLVAIWFFLQRRHT